MLELMRRRRAEPTTPHQAEWEMALLVTQHFNDLLMRLRSFGLPLVVTVGAVGFALSLDRHIADVPNWAIGVFLVVNVGVVASLLAFLLRAAGWGRVPEAARQYDIQGGLEHWEKVMRWIPLAFAIAAGGSYWGLAAVDRVDLTSEQTFSAGAPVLLFGLTILVVLYALDRFYYYKLLLGAVNRASMLERELQFRLTDTITALTAPRQSATIVTLIYFLPGIAAYSIMLALLVLNPKIT